MRISRGLDAGRLVGTHFAQCLAKFASVQIIDVKRLFLDVLAEVVHKRFPAWFGGANICNTTPHPVTLFAMFEAAAQSGDVRFHVSIV